MYRFPICAVVAVFVVLASAHSEGEPDPGPEGEPEPGGSEATPDGPDDQGVEQSGDHQVEPPPPTDVVFDEAHLISEQKGASNNSPPDKNSPAAGDPVLLPTGELLHEEFDLDFNGIGLSALTLQRTYTSKSEAQSFLGSNWTHNHDIFIRRGSGAERDTFPEMCRVQDDLCVRHVSGGRETIYVRPPGSSFYAPLSGDGSTMTVRFSTSASPGIQAFQGATRVEADGTTEHFNGHGMVWKRQDRFGNYLYYTYEQTIVATMWESFGCRNFIPAAGADPSISRFCGLFGVALGTSAPRSREVQQSELDIIEASLNPTELAVFRRIDSDAFLFPRYSPSVCQGDVCSQGGFVDRKSRKHHLQQVPSWGTASQRLTSVRDAFGRGITFTYFPWAEVGPEAGLLSEVRGPELVGDPTARVAFSYGAPASKIGCRFYLPDGGIDYEGCDSTIGEAFLTNASKVYRATGGTTSRRAVDYLYAWQSKDLDADRFLDHHATHLLSSFEGNASAAYQMARRIRSALLDNITMVKIQDDDEPIRLLVSSEYDEEWGGWISSGGRAFGSFDRVIGQYYGASLLTPGDLPSTPPGDDAAEGSFLFRYALNGDLEAFSPDVLTDGFQAWDNPRTKGTPAPSVPQAILGRYTAGSEDGGGLKVATATCRELARGLSGLSITSTPVTSPDSLFDRLETAARHVAPLICKWAQTTDRDGNLQWVGMNALGRPLVSAKFDEKLFRWIVLERLFDAHGRVAEERWPVATFDGPAPLRRRIGYSGRMQWTTRELRSQNNVRTIEEFPRGDSVGVYDDGKQHQQTGRLQRFSYELRYQQPKREVEFAIVEGQEVPVTEVDFEYVCPTPGPVEPRCTPGISACDKLSGFRDHLTTVRQRLHAFLGGLSCAASCPSELDDDLRLMSAEYVATLRELELHFLGDSLAEVSGTLASFDGFENAIVIDTAVDDVIVVLDSILDSQDFWVEFDNLRKTLDDSSCQKQPGACAKEQIAIEELVGKLAGDLDVRIETLVKLFPSSSADDYLKVVDGLLLVQTIQQRSEFEARLMEASAYTYKFESGYTKKDQRAFVEDAISKTDLALQVLESVQVSLPVLTAPRGGDVEPACARLRHDRVSTGLGNLRRVTDFEWAPNGLPSAIREQLGTTATLEYEHDGRGLLTATQSTLVEQTLASVGPDTPCPPDGLPPHLDGLLAGRCADRAGVGSGQVRDLLEVVPTEATAVSYDAQGHVVARTIDGLTTAYVVDGRGRLLRETSSSGRYTAYTFEADRIVSSTTGRGGDLRREVRVSDGNGNVLQTCVEASPASCAPFTELVSSIDFNDGGGCEDVAAFYAQLAPWEGSEFQLVINKWSPEGRHLCSSTPLGGIAEFSHDMLGRTIGVRDYNSRDRPRENARLTTYDYNLDSSVVRKTVYPSPDSHLPPLVFEMEYDGFGRPRKTVLPDGRGTVDSYDLAGHRSLEERRSSAAMESELYGPNSGLNTGNEDYRVYAFDPFGQILRVDINGVSSVIATYSPWGDGVRFESDGHGTAYRFQNRQGNLLWSRSFAGDEVVVADDPTNRETLLSSIFVGDGAVRAVHTVGLYDEDGLETENSSFGIGDDGIPLERSASRTYNGLGFVVSEIDAEMREHLSFPNLLGWPLTVSTEHRPQSDTFDDVTYEYAANGTVTSVVDPGGNVTIYEVDGEGMRESVSYPNGEFRRWERDGFGRVGSILLPNGSIIEFERDDGGRVIARRHADTLLDAYTYDDFGRLVSTEARNDVDGTTFMVRENFAYDGLHRRVLDQVSVGDDFAGTRSEWSDLIGRQKRTVWRLNGGIEPLFRQLFDGDSRLIAFAGQDWMESFQYRGGIVRADYESASAQLEYEHQRNAFGERVRSTVAAEAATPAFGVDYIRDRIGRINAERTEWSGGIERWNGYRYGDRGRLVEASVLRGIGISADTSAMQGAERSILDSYVDVRSQHLNATRKTWARNILGSPTKLEVDGVATAHWTYAAGEELLETNQGGNVAPVLHDDNHHLLSDGRLQYEFSPHDRLRVVLNTEGQVLEGFIYTATGRLAGVVKSGEVVELFALDGADMVASVDPRQPLSAPPDWTAYWSANNSLLRFETSDGAALLPVLDSRGSVLAGYREELGIWSASVEYDEQGLVVGQVNQRPAIVEHLPFGYAGAWVSSSGIVSMRNRWYQPQTGQFLSADPMEYVDSFNRFAYAGFDPINHVDPFGLDAMKAESLDESDDRDQGPNVEAENNTFVGGFSDRVLQIELDLVANLPAVQILKLQLELFKDIYDAATDPTGQLSEKLSEVLAVLPGVQEFQITSNLIVSCGGGGGASCGAAAADATVAVLSAIALKSAGKGALAKGGGCFEAGTMVETEGGPRPIEDIRPGDLVLAKDEATGEVAFRAVEAVSVREVDLLLDLAIVNETGASEVLKTTEEHPFMTRDGWVPAGKLRVGDTVLTLDGEVEVTSVSVGLEKTLVYNFTVEGFHTYFVGETGAWVHNTSSIGPPRASPYSLRRTHNLSGKAASKNVDNLTNSMKQNGFDPGSPVDVFRVGDDLYVLNGHHRVAAAKSAGVDVAFREVGIADLAPYGYASAADVVNAWVNVAPDRLR